MISKACYKPHIIFFHFQLTVQDFLPIDTENYRIEKDCPSE